LKDPSRCPCQAKNYDLDPKEHPPSILAASPASAYANNYIFMAST